MGETGAFSSFRYIKAEHEAPGWFTWSRPFNLDTKSFLHGEITRQTRVFPVRLSYAVYLFTSTHGHASFLFVLFFLAATERDPLIIIIKKGCVRSNVQPKHWLIMRGNKPPVSPSPLPPGPHLVTYRKLKQGPRHKRSFKDFNCFFFFKHTFTLSGRKIVVVQWGI